MFIDRQRENGQLPCYVRDSKKWPKPGPAEGFSQVQECVSFGSLCLAAYELVKEKAVVTEKAPEAAAEEAPKPKRTRKKKVEAPVEEAPAEEPKTEE